ncbi:helix-turn-helix transcriptional regulator [Sphaerisporangium aureirubrum]|uniref:Helix-turn-helix transcriptional regulator n=1 Tax=Sphaerisporangium aureirubrum TaxID=1544736 RepID=A0ABW1NQ00_9ACTN
MANVTTPLLTTAEIAALALSLAHLGEGPQALTARRALRRMLDTLDLDDEVTASTLDTLTTPLPPDVARRARTIANAVTGRQVIRLHYRDAGGRVSSRDVEPVTCLVHRTHWYLVGWCRSRIGIRAFRFDRIVAAEPTLIPARPHRAERYLPFQRRITAA